MRSLLAALLLLVVVPAAANAESSCWKQRVKRADAVARSRAGDVTFAVIDTRGHIHGKRYTTPVRGVSTIKSLLLLTFLRQPSVRHRSLTSAEKRLLDRMIRYSDNGAASTMIGRLGERPQKPWMSWNERRPMRRASASIWPSPRRPIMVLAAPLSE